MSEVRVLSGNNAAAIGVALSNPDVIAAYPITPQTPLVEELTSMRARGLIDSEMSEVESELSAMSVVTGASLGGSRVFTATSSQGLALMYEPYFRASTLRLPIVMCIVNREMISPQSLWGSPQDSLSVRDAGWIQLYVENNQEILDTVIQAYKLAEDERVLLPVNVCYDGFYLSHMSERVEVPSEEKVQNYVGEYEAKHIKLDPDTPMAVDPLTDGELVTEYRYKHLEAQHNALTVIDEIDKEFEELFGRSYGGVIEEYKMEDADYALITLGSMSGAAKEAADLKREEGIKVGVVRIRVMRPFPAERIAKALENVKAIGVVDRNVSFGWNHGITYQEVNSALYRYGKVMPTLPFVAGLGGEDIQMAHFEYAIDKVVNSSEEMEDKTIWLNKVL